jgi:ABC-2 type transport system permease protein
MRFALQGQFNAVAFGVVLVGGLVFFGLALRGYDPQRGWIKQRG